MVITGPAQIAFARAIHLEKALRLELKTGMRVSRKFSPYKIVKKEFGLRGNKQNVHAQLKMYIDGVLKKAYVPPEDGKPHCVYDD